MDLKKHGAEKRNMTFKKATSEKREQVSSDVSLPVSLENHEKHRRKHRDSPQYVVLDVSFDVSHDVFYEKHLLAERNGENNNV